jgi:DNA ligase (NAD+)
MRKEELENEIAIHDKLYWEKNAPVIADEVYDALVKELRDLDPGNVLVNRVPSGAVPLGTFKHERPMLSLDKAYTKEELLTWARGVAREAGERFLIMPKVDGVACEVNERHIVTRGDGENGEIITGKAPIINLSEVTSMPCRGELVVLKSVLAKLERPDGKPYKTCRSAAAGLLGLKETETDLGQVIRFVNYEVTVIGTATLAELEEIDWEATMLDEQAADYPVDGLVIALADREYGESLGANSHHPRHSVAFKCKNPETTSKIIDVEWQPAKTRIAPVAILKPTELDGVTISRATLHNLDEIARLSVGIGSKVKLARAGSVIPAVIEGLSPGDPIVPPETCPACAAPTWIDAQNLKCSNPHCGGVAAKKLRDALVRLEIDECGPAVCSSLVALGKLTPSAVLRMSWEDWLKVDGYAKVSATKAFNRVQQRLRTPIDDFRVLAAMNFEGIGLTNARKIMDVYNARDLTAGADLAAVEGIGEVRAKAIDLGIEWVDLLGLLQVVESKGQLSRPQVVFTGADARPREEWIKLAEERGYVFNKTVTKKTTVLVLADVNSTSTKAKKARQYGTVKLMTYEEFGNGNS